MKKIIPLLFLFYLSFSQTTDDKGLIMEGNEAFLSDNLSLAKERFTKVTELYPKNKDGWYNLAATELRLGETDNACEHFYKVYLLNDLQVVENIKTYCPNFRNGKIMSIKNVQEPPKFVYKEVEYNLFENNLLNPVYIKIVIKELKKSRILKEKTLEGKMLIQIIVNSFGVFDGKILTVPAEDQDKELVKLEALNIFKTAVKYKSAKNNGMNVDLWEKPTLPLQF